MSAFGRRNGCCSFFIYEARKTSMSVCGGDDLIKFLLLGKSGTISQEGRRRGQRARARARDKDRDRGRGPGREPARALPLWSRRRTQLENQPHNVKVKPGRSHIARTVPASQIAQSSPTINHKS
jgi:hypothetical protein